MNTPRTDAAWSATFDGEQISAGRTARALRECSQQLETELAALTAERDQLRLDCDNETKWAAHYLAQSIADKARAERAEAERNQLRAEVERLKTGGIVELAAINSSVLEYCKHWEARAERAEADLATERARLDWLMAGGMCLVQHSGGFHVSRLHCQVSRAAIDLGMKEDAK